MKVLSHKFFVYKEFIRIFLFFIPVVSALLFFPSSSSAQTVEAFTNLGLYGGQIYDIAIDPNNPDKMFAGSYMADGLFTTTDGGSSWQAVETNGVYPGEDDFKNQANYAVKIAPNSDIVWAAHNYWVEKSEDGGQTWTHILNSTMQRGMLNPDMSGGCINCGSCFDYGTTWNDCEYFRFIRSIAIDPSDPSGQTVYVGTSGRFSNWQPAGAVFKTTDGGDTWEKMNGGINFDLSVVDVKFDPNNNNILWAVTSPFFLNGSEGTLYRSDNRGDTWSAIYNSTDGAFSVVEVKPDDSNTVFTGSKSGLRKHFFNGSTWITQDLYAEVGGWLDDIVFDPGDPLILYATWTKKISDGGDGIGRVSRSTDGGNTWVEISNHDYRFMTLTVHPADSQIIIASDYYEGIFRSDDYGQTWTQINNGLNAVIVYDVAIDPEESNHILACTISGIYANKNKGAGDWIRRTKSSTKSILFNPENSQRIYAGIKGYLIKSLDGGVTWSDQYSSYLLGDGSEYPHDIAFDPDTNFMFIAVGGGKIYKSENEGDSFYEVLDGVNQDGKNYDFNAIVIDPDDNDHIFAGGGNYFSPRIIGDLWESTDGGGLGTWNRTSLQNENEQGVIVNAILIDPQDSNTMYVGAGYSAGTDSPLYKSTDGGLTWDASFDGIPNKATNWKNAVTDLAFHRHNTDVVYASTSGAGIYISPNQAQNWLDLGTPEYDVFAIATSSLYSATQGGLLQLTGTGLIAGDVTDANTQLGIDGATVFTDFGVQTTSANGEYMTVSPSGIFDVTSVADGYSNTTVENITVFGGDVAWQNIPMQSGISDPSAPPGQGISVSAGGGGCFIATAAYGSPLAKQVEILRKLRDKYLLPNSIGQKFVASYYRTGKPMAVYIESHPWLKPPVRVVLYPIIGLAWLIISTTTLTKGIIGVFILMGFVYFSLRLKLRRANEV